ncbi:MAG: ATP-dependent chaperone ClpB, partial [Planctomycetaceae bacterium]|nr:ATP-dependent chaperone ClpB [Planctomycetaceae bacterium]
MAFRPEKLTAKAQEALQNAHGLAQEKGHRQIQPLHLLQGLLRESDSIPRAILAKIGANVSQIQKMVDSELDRLPSSSGSNMEIGASPDLMKVFDAAEKLAESMHDQFVSTEHL